MKKVFALVLAALMVVTMFAGCGASKSAEGANVIKIGLTGPLTGGAAAYGLAVQAGMESRGKEAYR